MAKNPFGNSTNKKKTTGSDDVFARMSRLASQNLRGSGDSTTASKEKYDSTVSSTVGSYGQNTESKPVTSTTTADPTKRRQEIRARLNQINTEYSTTASVLSGYQRGGMQKSNAYEIAKAKADALLNERGELEKELESLSTTEDYSVGKGVAGVLQKGLQQVAQFGGDTLAMAEDFVFAPMELLTGQELGAISDNGLFNKWAKSIREEGQRTQDYYAANVEAGGKAAQLFDEFGTATVAAAPQAVMAILTGGGSMAAQTTAGLNTIAQTAMSSGVKSTISNVVSQMAKDPQYWTSFAQMVGGSYENAIADMEQQVANGEKQYDNNTIRAKAALQAIGGGLMNAAIEVGGGIQKLPEEMRGGMSGWKALVDSAIDEGKEEVLQGIVERATQNLVYDKGNALASLTDPDAVFSLPSAAKEFAGGALVGGVLSGGQIGTISALNKVNDIKLGKVGNDYTESQQELINEGLSYGEDTEAYRIASELQERLAKGETLSSYDLGRAVVANQRAINTENRLAEANRPRQSVDNSSPVMESSVDTEPVQSRVATIQNRLAESGMEATQAESVATSLDRILSGDTSVTNKDKNVLSVGNVEARAIFEEETGVKLPASNSSTRKAISDYVAQTAVKQQTATTEKSSATVVKKETVVNQTPAQPKSVASTEAAPVKNIFTDYQEWQAQKTQEEAINQPEGNTFAVTTNSAEATLKQAAEAAAARSTVENAVTVESDMTSLGVNGQKAYQKNLGNAKSVSGYSNAFKRYYKAGLIGGLKFEEIKTAYDDEVDRVVAFEAFSAGQNDASVVGEGKPTTEKKNAQKGVKTPSKGKGKFYDSRTGEGKAKNSVSKEVVKTLKAFARVFNVDIELLDTLDVEGNKSAANGYYDPETNKIYLAADSDNPLMTVLKHEVTHHIKKVSPKQYKALKDYVMKAYYDNSSEALNAEIEIRIEAALEDGVTLTRDEAMDEIVADATEKFLTDRDTIDALVRENRSLAETILNAIRDVLRKVEEALRGVEIEGIHSWFMNADQLKQAEKMWVEALIEASQSGIGVDSVSVSESSAPIWSLKSMKFDLLDGKMRRDLVEHGILTAKEANNLMKQINKLIDDMSPFAHIVDMNEEYTKGNRPFNVYKPNSDPLYKVSLDFSTLCKKRLMTQFVMESLQTKLGKALSAKEQLAIRSKLEEYGKTNKQIQVACALCYVEARRLKAPDQINRFLDDRTTILTDYFGKKNKAYKASVDEMADRMKVELGYKADTKLKNLKPADKKKINTSKQKMMKEYTPTAEEQKIIERANAIDNKEFLSQAGLTNLSLNDPVIYDAFVTHVRNATKSKALESGVPYYYGDSKSVSDALIEAMNAENGLRHQSWSDFEIVHLLDNIAAVIELSVRKAKMHAYTKVPNFVKVNGNTGIMINLSLIPAGKTGIKDGKLDFSPTEGMDYQIAAELRDQYHKTTGTIAIGIDDQQIAMMLDDEAIDYVIPYHTSGMNAQLRKMAGISGWADYESFQSEKEIKGAEQGDCPDELWHKKPDFSEWFDTSKLDMSKSGVEIMREAAGRYLVLCEERGLKPKFSDTKKHTDFSKHENYWKMLIDRKMVDKDGNIIIQQAVRPDFDFDTISEVVGEEIANYDPTLLDSINEKVMAEWESGGIKQREKELLAEEKTKKKAAKVANGLLEQTVAPKGKKQYSQKITEARVKAALADVMDHADAHHDNVVLLGDIPDYLSDISGIEGDLYIFRNHAYENMVSEEQAIQDGRIATTEKKRRRQHFHELGDETMTQAILALDHPLITIADTGEDGNPGISMILPVFDKNNNPIHAFVSFYADEPINGEHKKRPHIAVTFYGHPYEFESGDGRKTVVDFVQEAVDGGKVLDFDRKKLRVDLPVIAKNSTLGNVAETTLKKRVAQFQKDVNKFKADHKINYQLKNTSDEMFGIPKQIAEAEHEAKAVTDAEVMKQAVKDLDLTTEERTVIRNYQNAMKKLAAYEEELAVYEATNGQHSKHRSIYTDASGKVKKSGVKHSARERAEIQRDINWWKRQLREVEQRESFKKILKREKAKMAETHAKKMSDLRDAYNQRLKDVRAKRDEKVEAEKQKMRDYKQHQRDSKEYKALKGKLEADVKWLSDRLVNPTESKHIPDKFRGLVAKFLETLDFTTERMDKNAKNGNPSGKAIKLWALIEEYQNIAKGEDSDLVLTPIEQAFYDSIKETFEGGKRIEDLTYEELGMIRDFIRYIKTGVAKANQMFNDEIKETTSELGESLIQELRSKKVRKDYTGLLGVGDKLMNYDNVAPADKFHEFGGVMEKLYHEIRKGFDKHIGNVQSAISYTQNLISGNEDAVKEWSGKKAKTTKFQISDGTTIELTPAQVMSLYCLLKRDQAVGHILGSGIVPSGVEVQENKRIGKVNLPATKKLYSERSSRCTIEDIAKIVGTLTDEQRKVADGVMKFFTTKCADWGNETSMKLFDIKKFTESNYFPIKSSDAYLNARFDDSGDVLIKNLGFTKNTVVNANNPIVIEDIFDVLADHTNKMSMYNALVVPLTDFTRVFNYKSKDGDGTINDSVQKALEAAGGNLGIQYIKQFMKDVNKQANSLAAESFINQSISRYKKAKIAASARVLLQQPTAIARAAAMVDPKYLISGLQQKANYEEMFNHSEIAYWKSLGFYQTDMGRNMKDILLGNESLVDKVTMSAYGKADDFAWGHLWEAIKLEQADAHPNMDTTSSEFMDLVSERFEEVVDRTQVVDSVFHRSQIMRSPGAATKVATAFMSEPTKAFNLLRTDLIDSINSKDYSKIKRSVVTYVANAVLVSAFAGIADMIRDDEDEDEDGEKRNLWDKYRDAVSGNIVDNINPLGMIPYIKEINSMLQGYDVNRMEMASLAEFVKTAKKWTQDKYSAPYLIKETAEDISELFGVPLKNVIRDMTALVRTAGDIVGGNYYADYMVDKMKYKITNSDNRSVFYKHYTDALLAGDDAAAEAILADMVINGIPYDNIIAKGYQKQKEAAFSEARKLITSGKTDEAKKLIRQLAKRYDKKYTTLWKAVKNGDSAGEPEETYDFKDLQKAIRKDEDTELIEEYLTEYGGYSEEDLKEAIKLLTEKYQ